MSVQVNHSWTTCLFFIFVLILLNLVGVQNTDGILCFSVLVTLLCVSLLSTIPAEQLSEKDTVGEKKKKIVVKMNFI